MSYRPEADPSAYLPGAEQFRRRREEVVRFLRENDLVGLTLERARGQVEGAGFRLRTVDLDTPGPHALSADLAPDRVTATLRGGAVLRAEPF